MIVLQEELQNVKFQYYFIKSYEWTQLSDIDRFQKHPLPGRVYRGQFNTQTNLTKIVIADTPSPVGLGFDNLMNNDPEKGFVCEIIPLTLENILDYKILEEDLDKIIQWQSAENKPMYQPTDQGLMRLKQAMNQQELDEAEAMDKASYIMMELWSTNALKFDIVLNFVQYLTQKDIESYNDIASYLTQHPEKGMGINIATALRLLDRYVGDSRRTNQNIEDLFETMTACITECERKISNNLVD